MRRLIVLTVASAAASAAFRAIARRRAAKKPGPPQPGVMPRPTAAPPATPREEPVAETPDRASSESSEKSETPGHIDEGDPGAITAAPVPEEPAPAPPPRPDDAQLERAVESEIAEDPAVPDEAVQVDVEGGVAQLRGSVPDEETAARVGDDAARVDGVIGLDDQLERPGAEGVERPGAEGEERPGAEGEERPGAAPRDPEQTSDG
jgi:hypothetical protein